MELGTFSSFSYPAHQGFSPDRPRSAESDGGRRYFAEPARHARVAFAVRLDIVRAHVLQRGRQFLDGAVRAQRGVVAAGVQIVMQPKIEFAAVPLAFGWHRCVSRG